MKIEPQDIRKAGFCMSGARNWFASYGLDWNDFLSNGIDISTFRDLNDAYGNRVADTAEARHGQE